MPAVMMLGEVMVHVLDIRRPLGLASEVAPEALAASLDLVATAGSPVWSKRNVAGLTFRATDLDWTHGAGPTVSGPAESLLLAMVNRHVGLGALDGEGVPPLRARLS